MVGSVFDKQIIEVTLDFFMKDIALPYRRC